MLSGDEIQQLKSQNELLQIQLNDINEIINIREEELGILRNKVVLTTSLKSTLEGNLDQILQMQHIIGEQQRISAGCLKREAAMEDEIVESVRIEKEYFEIKEKYESSKAANRDLDSELAETAGMYLKLAASNGKVAELESSLEIAMMENKLLREKMEELIKLKAIQQNMI